MFRTTPQKIWNKSSVFRASILPTLTLSMPQQVTKSVHFPSEASNRKKNHDSSHTALNPVLFLGQIFAIMPVSGITSKSAIGLKFDWFNLRTLHTLIVLSGQAIMTVISARWAATNPLSMSILEPIIWFSTKFVLLAYFLWLAKKWPSLMVEWERIEQMLPVYVGRKRTFEFSNQIKLHAILITTLLAIEHSMCMIVGINRVSVCTNSTSFEGYFKQSWPQVYTIVKYDGGIRGILSELLNYYCTFLWTFMDIFIISISICLSTRFNLLNDHLKQFKGMKMPKAFWCNQREHFTSIVTLIAKVDDNISVITAFSVSSNLYTILLLLLHSFQPQDTITETIYFWFTLLFMISRTVLVSLTAARINDESRKPARVIRAIPSDAYDSEANRFLEQVVNTKVGLTGMRFFYFTRPLILSVVGTIITYELVLMQFSILTPKTKENLCQAF